MRKEKALIDLLRGLVSLLAQESACNPDFAEKVEHLLSALPEKKSAGRKSPAMSQLLEPPDIYAEWNARGEAEFRLWLREQPVATLRALISQHDLDAARRTSKWKDIDKLSAHIADQLQARMARGSSFLKSGDNI